MLASAPLIPHWAATLSWTEVRAWGLPGHGRDARLELDAALDLRSTERAMGIAGTASRMRPGQRPNRIADTASRTRHWPLGVALDGALDVALVLDGGLGVALDVALDAAEATVLS